MTSGVRLGTPAVTTRGLKEEDMEHIAEAISLVIKSEDNIGKGTGNRSAAYKEIPADLTKKYRPEIEEEGERMKTKHRNDEEYRKLMNRLNRVEGQVRGVKKCWKKSSTVLIFSHRCLQFRRRLILLIKSFYPAIYIPVW